MRIVALSDTHELHQKFAIPDGDVFVFAGDFTMLGEARHVERFNKWLGKLPHKYKIVIAGNHDLTFDSIGNHYDLLRKEGQDRLTNATHYLLQSGCEIEGLRFWGSPYTPRFFDWAFMYDRAAGKEQWDEIPERLDMLVTHGPPMYEGDKTLEGKFAGCWDLNRKVKEVKPRHHIFGHIHEGYGTSKDGNTVYHNVSAVDRLYRPRQNPCLVLELEVQSCDSAPAVANDQPEAQS